MMTTSTQLSQRQVKRRGRSTSAHTRAREGGRRLGSHALLVVLALYFIIPIWWLLVAATKSTGSLFSSPAFWFDNPAAFFTNVAGLFEHQGGIYWRWLANSFIYAFTAGIGATVIAVLAGYGFAKYRFKGRGFVFGIILDQSWCPSPHSSSPRSCC